MKVIRNPDTEYYEKITKAVEENDGYCPCNLVKSNDTLCMCKEFRDQEVGECRCGRFIKVTDKSDVDENVESAPLKTLKKVLQIAENSGLSDEDPVSFTLIVGSCFPQVYKNIMDKISDEYMRGFMEGFQSGKNYNN